MTLAEKQFNFSNSHHDLMRRDAESVLGWRYEPRVMFAKGKGIVITDVDGNDYYDMTSGMMCMVLGHSHPELVDAIRDQADKLVHESSWYGNPWLIEFAELIGSTLPGDLKLVNFAVTGSEANEIAMRLALGVTGKYDIVSIIRGLHGGSLAAEGVTAVGGARKSNLGPLLPPAHRNAIYAPLCYRCPINLTYPSCDIACLKASDELMEHVTTREVALIMAETIPVAGGMIVPPQEWLGRLQELAKRWGALFCLDEAQLAPAKTGKIWAFEHYGVVPDILTFGKGMTAGMGIAGTVTTKAIADEARGKAGIPWGGTYSGDPLPAAVALKQFQIVLRDNIAERAAKVGAYLGRRLDELVAKYEPIGDKRGLGLYYMLDIVSSRQTKAPDPAMAERIRYNALLEGLVLIAVKNFVRICPPLIITEAEVDEAVGRLERAIQLAIAGYPKNLDFSQSSSLAAIEPG
ncbi:MAG: aspartate aminotransferase family protein [Alphaproteobacteria bacterium]|nr:aspartate aminotransferase family protein [Alphaproteobacteria bacterium]